MEISIYILIYCTDKNTNLAIMLVSKSTFVGNFNAPLSLTLHGIRRRIDMKQSSDLNDKAPNVGHGGPSRPACRRRSAIFTGHHNHTEIEDEWHRILTGRQSPVPVGQKLQMIYGRVVAEQLPPEMLDLLSRLDNQSVES